jgi:AcrR family transcriptional regulator
VNEKEQAILDAAEQTFAAQGFKEASIREITSVAGVNSAMLSYYFHSKEKLLEAVLERRIRRFAQKSSLLSLQSMSAAKKLMTVIGWHIGIISRNTPFFRFILREHLISSSDESARIINRYVEQKLNDIKAVLTEGVNKGEFKQMDVDLTSISIAGAYVNCLLIPNFISGAMSGSELCKRLATHFEDYIQTLSSENST